jgi:hypothetical protein
MEEKLSDLSRNRSSLASEALAAVHLTDEAQWERLLHDVNHGQVFFAEAAS